MVELLGDIVTETGVVVVEPVTVTVDSSYLFRLPVFTALIVTVPPAGTAAGAV